MLPDVSGDKAAIELVINLIFSESFDNLQLFVGIHIYTLSCIIGMYTPSSIIHIFLSLPNALEDMLQVVMNSSAIIFLAWSWAFSGVPSMEHQRLQQTPYLGIAPVFAKDVGWVVNTWDVCEHDESGGDTLTDTVKGQRVVSFV